MPLLSWRRTYTAPGADRRRSSPAGPRSEREARPEASRARLGEGIDLADAMDLSYALLGVICEMAGSSVLKYVDWETWVDKLAATAAKAAPEAEAEPEPVMVGAVDESVEVDKSVELTE